MITESTRPHSVPIDTFCQDSNIIRDSTATLLLILLPETNHPELLSIRIGSSGFGRDSYTRVQGGSFQRNPLEPLLYPRNHHPLREFWV